MDSENRRDLLAVTAHSATGPEMTVRLSGPCALGAPSFQGLTLAVTYVPDKLLLVPVGFTRYLAALGRQPWTGLEALVAAIIEDLNNELVPRWLRVTASVPAATLGLEHQVAAEDRQPRWQGTPPPPGSV